MKVFVFGAGASKGSQTNAAPEQRAPLVNDLFDPNYFPYANLAGFHGGDMVRFRQAVGEDGGSLEAWLTQKWENINRLRQDVSKQAERGDFGRLAFYIASLLLAVSATYGEDSGYGIFALKLRARDEEYGLINFNYDTLLDWALHHRFTRDFGRIDDYFAFNYLKPHGSVNWFLPARSGEIFSPYKEVLSDGERDMGDAGAKIAYAASLMFNGPPMRGDDIIVIRPNHQDLHVWNLRRLFEAFGWNHFYPLVFMPLTTKVYSLVEGFERQILGKGTEFMRKATEIFLIGYKANDQIIKEMMSGVNRETLLHVVGMNDAGDIADRVCSWSPNLKRGLVYTEGFLQFVKTQM